LVITGDIDYEATLKMVKSYYSPWTKGYVTPKIEKEPVQNGERKAKVDYPGKTLPVLSISYKGEAFSPTNKMWVATQLFGELAFGETSDLYKKLYIKEQKIQSLFHDIQMNRDPNLFFIYAIIKNENDVSPIQNEIESTIKVFQTKLADKEKLDNLKKRLKYSYLMSLDTPNKVAENLARILAVSGEIETVNIYFATLESVTLEDIRTATQKYFVPEKRTVVTLTGSK
ncbi:MAG: insulinase family protein, partial [Bacteroidota bacterium]